MSNFSGDFKSILSRKLQDLVSTLDSSVNKETRGLLLTKLLVMSNNPAYRAAMIVALKSSKRLEAIKTEIANPSFLVENHDNYVPNKPSEFTDNYEDILEFVDNTYNIVVSPPNGIEETSGQITVKSGQTLIATFAIPP